MSVNAVGPRDKVVKYLRRQLVGPVGGDNELIRDKLHK